MIFLNSYLKLMGILILLSCTSLIYGQLGWVKHYELPDTNSFFYDVEPTQDGGYFLVGSMREASPLALYMKPLIIRVDSDGDIIWRKKYPSLLASEILEVKELPNGGAIFMCSNTTNVYVGATTAAGEIDWIQTYIGSPPPLIDGARIYGKSLQNTDDGNFLVIDDYGSAFKITPSGTILWTAETHDVALPFFMSGYGNNMVEIGNDSFVVVGGENISTSFLSIDTLNMTAIIVNSTGVIQRKVLDSTDMKGISVIRTNDQSLLFVGNTDFNLNDSLVLIKTDDNLNTIWRKKHFLNIVAGQSPTTSIEVWGIEEIANGEIWCLVGEQTTGLAYLWIYVFDSNGNYLKTVPLSTVLASTTSNYLTYTQSLGLVLGNLHNPIPKLIKSGDGQLVVGLTWYSHDTYIEGMALVKVDTSGFIRPALEGTVFGDYNMDCNLNSGDIPLAGWPVTATRASDGLIFYGTSDTSGFYEIQIDSGTFTVELSSIVPSYWQPCILSHQVTFNGQARDTIDFALQPMISCPLMRVDLSVPLLRMTASSDYTVSACNLGTAVSPNTRVEVIIDPTLNVLGTSIPITSQNNNVYTFNIGTVPVGVCEEFTIQVKVDTSAQIGQTHCSEAHVYPDSICIPSYWNGAVLEVDGNCTNDTVFFEITNTGANMVNNLEYYVFEDHVMMRQGTFLIANGITTVVAQPALPGKTYRLSAEQEANFPPLIGDLLATRVVEGCVLNSNGSFNIGFVNQFSNGFRDPFTAIDCQPNISSYDPNDKSAQPEGYQSQHYIDAITAIDYKVRFQNTGTDTAFHVMIKDTLSPHLDPSSIQMGASSHAYTWRLLDNGILKVSFSDIQLVDSTANEPLSHGFFRYRIHQQPNNTAGTVINNSAAIYFDYNPPIITNTTFHTVGENFITINLSTAKIYEKDIEVKLYPNPFKDFTTLEVQGEDYEKLTLKVYDLSGRVIQTLYGQNTSSMKIYRQDLPQGVYIYQLEGDGQRISTGKMVVQGN
jgi:hypothetical protein